MSDSREQEDKDFLAFLCQHIVALGGIFTDKTTDPPIRKRFIYGGIVMSFYEEWFFVTAGHALENLSKAVDLGLVDNLSFIDYMSYQALNKMPVPFVYDKRAEVAIFNEGNGVDFGIYYLREYYQNAMKKNEVVPLPETRWQRQPQHSKVSLYMMLGLPESFIDDSDPKAALFKAYLISFNRLEQVPEQYLRDDDCGKTELDITIRDSMFYGRIPDGATLPKDKHGKDDIKGMSGGPVFMFLPHHDTFRYWVVALQSSWYGDTRVIRAMPLPDIGRYMKGFLDEKYKTYGQQHEKDKADDNQSD